MVAARATLREENQCYAPPMASHFAPSAFSPTPNAGVSQLRSPRRPPPPPAVLCVQCYGGSPYNTLVSEAVRLLVPPARFEASKLKVNFTGGESDNYSGIIPRTYILSHCDFTANLNLTISNVINLDQLRGWYEKDDVVAEWKSVNKEMCLHIHCFVSGPNPFLELAAEFRYHIFSKEMPLVLKAVLHGDALLFTDHPELMDAPVWVYFHSSSQKYNRIECWGPFKDAAQNRENKFKDFRREAMMIPLCLESGEALNRSSKLCLPSFCKCAGNAVPLAPSKSPTQFSHIGQRMTQLIGNIAEKLHWR